MFLSTSIFANAPPKRELPPTGHLHILNTRAIRTDSIRQIQRKSQILLLHHLRAQNPDQAESRRKLATPRSRKDRINHLPTFYPSFAPSLPPRFSALQFQSDREKGFETDKSQPRVTNGAPGDDFLRPIEDQAKGEGNKEEKGLGVVRLADTENLYPAAVHAPPPPPTTTSPHGYPAHLLDPHGTPDQ
ncbi:hypothetical protein BDV32DRAFT_149240 [Aspergillus pseudonomiae]|uniref:Uncharacterized protein n=1 Tax=Aspergillus pseudonomiae TaxID=1506151 RepID=A0A5N6I6S0_9EURO|nr:uncharacterized protein BDV37DRAFT_286190 [Aspergillus pseudonomiae]KAB8260803.1 hypothetical protein BDV32DRAFT_149240 [Aspergillus pseudonomiae]KAE8400961.1 hypothetical protein BDV37DRAFT_286190 [Aspergillus pseudonomiae]